MDLNALLRKTANADFYANADNIKEGIYTFSVKKMEVTEKGWFIATLRVDKAAVKNQEVTPNTVGTTCKVMAMLNAPANDPKYASHPGNAKSFITALVGKELSADEFVQTVGAFVGANQLAKGFKIDCETVRKAKKRSEGECVVYNWLNHPMSDEEADSNAKTL